MFDKKICKNCKEKISGKFDFCPHCGAYNGNNKNEDYGMLGKKDTQDPFEEMGKGLFGGMSGKMLNKMLGSAMKMLEKEMQKNMQNQTRINPQTNFELYINGKKINPQNIKVTKKEIPKNIITKKVSTPQFDEETQKRFSQLEKAEPQTNIRRLSNKVVYEIDVPGVESIKDVSVLKLENSLEIRAITKDKAYKKIISIDLPLKKYKLEKDKLILELGVKD